MPLERGGLWRQAGESPRRPDRCFQRRSTAWSMPGCRFVPRMSPLAEQASLPALEVAAEARPAPSAPRAMCFNRCNPLRVPTLPKMSRPIEVHSTLS